MSKKTKTEGSIRNSVILHKRAKAGDISVKTSSESEEGEKEPYSDAGNTVENSVIVGPLARTSKIWIRTVRKEKRGCLFGAIIGFLTSLCASAGWDFIKAFFMGR